VPTEDVEVELARMSGSASNSEAYEANMPDDEILKRLLALNLARECVAECHLGYFVNHGLQLAHV
jgi:hypothetical protein